jgi:hypothetical protein
MQLRLPHARRLLVSGFALLVLAGSALAEHLPAPSAQYQARQSLTVNGAVLESVIHHDHGKERRESRVDGLSNLLIIRPDQPKAIVIQPESKMAMQIDATDPEVGVVPTALAGLDAKPLGPETLSGEKVVKYKVQDSFPQGGGFDGLVWSTPDGIYVRIEGTVTDTAGPIEMSMRLSDIKRGPQEAALFTPPPGLQMMDMAPEEGRLPPAFQEEEKK